MEATGSYLLGTAPRVVGIAAFLLETGSELGQR